MFEIVGVRFPKEAKIYYYNTDGLNLEREDWCVVQTDRGVDLARVVDEARIPDKDMDAESLSKVVRKATPADLEEAKENEKKEENAYEICLKKIIDRDLPMKLVDVHFSLDGQKITFYFTAEGRIDFRDLVKDLAYVFKTRIDLRQIGVRDEAKIFGGMGCCGRPLCCTTFLSEFDTVSIKMAKEQNLILAPSKISGVCGRLMCCLAYEYALYHEIKSRAPMIGAKVKAGEELGVVVDIHLLAEEATIEFEGGRRNRFKFSALGLTE